MKLDIEELPEGIRTFKTLNWDRITAKSSPVEANHGLGKPRDKGWPEDILKTAWRMVKTCLEEDGIGLAAPQIGIFKNIIICRQFEKDAWRYKFAPAYSLYLNPEFSAMKGTGKQTDIEFCLSVPGKGYPISRYNTIYLTWQEFNKKGELVSKTDLLEGWPARLAQHEIDHLNGISIPQRYELQNEPKKKKKTKRGKKK